jgi:AcrR family transcriptional regulator
MPSEHLDLQWVKPPRQERSHDTQQRIVDAAQRMMEHGKAFHEIGVAELVKEAHSSVGAFYSRFRDKDALLRVLQAELNREGFATAAETFAKVGNVPVAIDVLVRAFVSLAVTAYREQHGLRRALLVEMARDKGLRDRAAELSAETCGGLSRLLAARFPAAPPARVELAVDIAHRMVYGMLDQKLLFDLESPTSRVVDDDTLVAELTTALCSYLRATLD